MSHRNLKTNGCEPALGGHPALTGMEPALSREFGPLYGLFRINGLEAPAVPERRRPLVVLAERDPDTAQLVYLLAESNGYHVKMIDNGTQAWQMIQMYIPDLLVTNIQLVGMEGLGIIRRVRAAQNVRLRTLPVLVMDVHHRHQDVMAAFQSGADDYLEMPYDRRAMLRGWQRLLTLRRLPSPLTALQNEDVMIRQVALSDLLGRRPDGLVEGLSEYLWHPDRTLKTTVCWALRRLGTEAALAVLERHQQMLRQCASGM
ncbi:MAG: response regulator [Anaerolineae bacterium]|nr:response regulator [Anaerolineae bacterium]